MDSQNVKIHLVFILCLFYSCADIPDNGIPDMVSISDSSAFDEASDVSYTLDSLFTLDLWAPGPLLSNAVALSLDNEGNAYVTETSRRKSSDLDIRQHRDWMVEELALQSIEDTREFHLKKLATDLSDENTWLEDFNGDSIHDYRDLEVQSEIVRKISDTDGDGRADVSHVYADGINSMLTGVAAGVLFHDNEVYVTAAPDVFKMKDLDDDGDADERETISHGYGIHIAFAGHDMSGLIMGPDGKLYWAIGDMGVNVTDKTGKNWYYPHEGAAMRCNPDGTDFEVFAHGLRNTQELAFDAYGNLISVDNDGDHPGERERYVHILEGSDTGWRINWQYGKYKEPYEAYKVWMDEGLYLPYFEGQAAYITPALALAPNGPAGLAYNPGTALGSDFNHTFFGSYFTGNSKNSRISAFQLKPKGASFEVVNERDIVNGINSTGVTFGPDGALYINDWKESYSKKDAGRIWKLDSRIKNDKREQTAAILKAGTSKLDSERLSQLLHNDDMRVRQMAQFELVKRAESDILLQEAKTGNSIFGRLHAVWGYGQLMRQDSDLSKDISILFEDENEHVRAQLAKIFGDAREVVHGRESILQLLDDDSDHVKRFAIETLGKINGKEAFSKFVAQLSKFEDQADPHMRHTVSYALSKIAEGSQLEALKTHPSHHVRIGAVLALRHQRSPLIAAFLEDAEETVVTEAARAINDDASIPDALGALAESLTQSMTKSEAFLRRAINANLRIGNGAAAERLGNYYLNKNNARSMRLQAIWTLGYWADPPVLDRVDNQYRELQAGDLDAAKRVYPSIYNSAQVETDVELKAMILSVAGKLGYKDAEESLFDYVSDRSTESSVRKAALSSLGMMSSSYLTEAIQFVLDDSDSELRKEAQQIIELADISDQDKVEVLHQIIRSASPSEKQTALRSLGRIKAEKALDIIESLVSDLNTLEPEIQLDVILAAQAQESDRLSEILETYNQAKPKDDALAKYQEALYGGDPKKGRDIFAFNEAAQCLRCHKIQGYGGEVAPPLDNIGNEISREDLLLSLVDPNARIAPGYGNIYYTLTDGSEVSGIVAEETPTTLVIKDAAGKSHTILKSAIAEQENLPSGMLSQELYLEKSEIRDLVAFLATLVK